MYFSASLVAVSALIASCAGHSMLSTPAPRGNKKWWGTCSAGAGCKGPCDAPKADAPFNSIYVAKKYVQRGQQLEVVWNRLNHPGGFVRLAMVPFDQSDNWSAFNDNVLKYTCYETTCKTSKPEDTTFGYLNGGGDSPCTTTVTVPENIADGTAVTLQWIWFGGGIYYGEPDTSFGEYYGCSDMIVSGGPQSSTKPAATFVGGDATYPNSNVCKYWGSNKVGDCNFGDKVPSNPTADNLLSQSLEPCMHGPEKKGVPFGFGSSDESGYTNQTISTTSPAAPPPASDTASAAPASTPESASEPAPASPDYSAQTSVQAEETTVSETPVASDAYKCIPRPASAF
ncbi:hypothetical protein IW140_000045 [Coemansia sp. RSA 1813]|nr:hypothetical protein EV178_000153 [Coemansia sp. RSA 1646]KAJ1771378.1 hypothetical protein LPJ74_002418 [Coemansia sp. RSA 1843]KAJ2093151.1 hypothetical protein IW138_000443 [Coemansia sp. RSA 986]KAJ2217583.1 hypothetical protein EV179_000418 [Coemansia sp. RSA 487]KAJ2573404.1 hypothetical protein IW140_000045 [Coemansia sp. RSA 1813]